jgi:hypothetical protein
VNLGMPEIVLMFFLGFLCLIPLVVETVVAAILSSTLRRLPQRYQQMEPGLIWLLVIPLFNIGWNFFVVLKVSRSYRDYFGERRRAETGDCGEGLGLAYSVCTACSLVPYLGCLTGIAAIVLLVLYLVKLNTLKGLVVDGGPDIGGDAAPYSVTGYGTGYGTNAGTSAGTDLRADAGSTADRIVTPPPAPLASPWTVPGAASPEAQGPGARRCGRCGVALPGDAAFCPACGAPTAP